MSVCRNCGRVIPVEANFCSDACQDDWFELPETAEVLGPEFFDDYQLDQGAAYVDDRDQT